MSNVIVKENESLDSALRRQAFSRKFVKENITKSQALDVRRSLKLLENVSSTN